MAAILHRPVVLLADPIEATRDLIREVFRDELGAFVAGVDDARDLLRQLDEVLPSLIVVELPRSDGVQLLDRLRRHPAGAATPILAISGPDGADRAAALRAGCAEWLAKPLDLGVLVDRAGHLMGVTPISHAVAGWTSEGGG